MSLSTSKIPSNFRCIVWWLPAFEQWHFLQPWLSRQLPGSFRVYLVPQIWKWNCAAQLPVHIVSNALHTQEAPVITNLVLSPALNSNLFSSFTALRIIPAACMMPFTSMMASTPLTGFWGRCVATPLPPSTPLVFTWPCVSRVTVSLAPQDFVLTTEL